MSSANQSQNKPILVIGDLHLKPSNLKTARRLFDFIEEDDRFKKVDHLVLLGDVYDTKAIIRSEAQNFLFSYLSNTRFKNVSIIVGNHDYENLECQQSSLDPLKYLSCVITPNPKNVFIYSDQEVQYDYDYRLAFIPYIHDPKKFVDLVTKNSEKLKKCSYVFCHQGFQGFDLGGGILDESGVDISILPPTNFIVGHYHKSQRNKIVLYPGTPFSHSFGEANQTKQVLLLEGSSFRFIDTNLPQHYKFKFDASTGNFDFQFGVFEKKIKSDDLIDVVVSCKKSDQNRYDKSFIEKTVGISLENLKLRYSFTDSESIIRIDEGMTIEKMFEKYLTIKQRPNLLAKGLEYLNNASL